MSNVYKMINKVPGGQFAHGGEPPDNGVMEARIKKLEDGYQDVRERLVHIETRVEQTATKADLADNKSEMIKWIVGTAVAMSAAAITVMTFVLNNATPKAPAASPQPIVIYAPAPAAQPVPVAPAKP